MMTSTSPLAGASMVAFVAATDTARARRFYGDALGFRLLSEDQFALVFDAAGTILRVQMVEKAAPPPYTALGWRVEDIAATASALKRVGVTCERFPGMQQDQFGIWQSPSGARVAWFKDPEGHILSLTQSP